MSRKELADFPKLEIYADTPAKGSNEGAILVSEDGGTTKHWLPKSQIEWEYENKNPMSRYCSVTMPVWLASQKGFAGY